MGTDRKLALVTGAAGLVGDRIAKRLLRDGLLVRTLDQRPVDVAGAESCQADVTDPVAVQRDFLVLPERFGHRSLLRIALPGCPVFDPDIALCLKMARYLIWTPEIARLITSRWISEVPSKIVQILASRCIRSTGNSRL